MSQTRRDWNNSRRVRTHERNSEEIVRRLGTIIKSIFCAQSGAGIRFLNFRPYLKTFVAPFLPTRRTAPGSPRMEANRLAIYKHGRGFEDLNSELPRTNPACGIWTRGPPDFKFSALTARPRRLLILHYSVLVKKYKKTFFVLFINTSFPILHNLTQEEPIK